MLHNNKGLCHKKLKNNTDAKKEFSKALEIKPDYIKPRVLRMNMLKTEGEYELALEDAKRIDQFDP
jgi:Tfp pilus assembly protein PilF